MISRRNLIRGLLGAGVAKAGFDVWSATPPSPTIDAIDNPYDLRPVINAIMNTQNVLMDTIPDDQPIVIIMGERHDHPINSLLQEGVLKALLKQREQNDKIKFSFGLEWASNETVFLSTRDNYFFPASAALFAFCDAHDIPLAFSDAVRAYKKASGDNTFEIDEVLKKDDPLNAKLIHDNFPAWEGDSLISREGMAIRNMAMVENATRLIRETKSKIYVQHCGQNHAIGSIKNPYKESLRNLFEKQGCATITVMPEYELVDLFLPDGARRWQLDNFITVTNLSNDEESQSYFSFWRNVSYRSLRHKVNKESGFILNQP